MATVVFKFTAKVAATRADAGVLVSGIKLPAGTTAVGSPTIAGSGTNLTAAIDAANHTASISTTDVAGDSVAVGDAITLSLTIPDNEAIKFVYGT